MNKIEQNRYIVIAAQHAQTNGHDIANCVELIEHPDCVVVHFARPIRTDPTGVSIYFDTPDTIVVMINRLTSKCTVPDLF